MKREASGEAESERRPAQLLQLALYAGLLTGFVELAAVGVHMLEPGFARRSRDALWMIPVADAILFVLIGAGIAGIARLTPLSWGRVAGFFVALGSFLVLLLFQSLHWTASALLAAGIGVQAQRLQAGQKLASQQFIRRALPWLALLVGAIGASSVAWRKLTELRVTHSRPAAEHNAPNVLLLILDTVRAANLGLYGYARPTSPELDRFGARATTFDRAFAAAPWTLTSHASIFTGHWPLELDASWDKPLGERWSTLAELLRARGYATAAFAANDIYVTWETGLSRGFEHFDDFEVSPWVAFQSTALGRVVYPAVHPWLASLLENLPLLSQLRLPLPAEHRPAPEIIDAFLAWLNQDRSAPFFAFLNLMDAHFPYTPFPAFRSRFRSALSTELSQEAWSEWPKHPLTPTDARPREDAYDGSIALMDTEVGRLLRELDHRGLLKNTIVIVTSDHGDEYGEHGLVDHGRSLYRLSLHVPLVVSFPGHVPMGERVKAPVSLRNLAATILDLAGAKGPLPVPGRSLARFWSSTDTSPDTIVASVNKVWHAPQWYPVSRGDLYSIAFGGWRYMRNEGDGTEELYDFDNDVLERWNLVGTPEGNQLLERYRSVLSSLRVAPREQERAGL